MRAMDRSASSPSPTKKRRTQLAVHGVAVEGEAGRIRAAMLAAVQHVDEGAAGRLDPAAVLEHDSRDPAHGRSPRARIRRRCMIIASGCVLRPADVGPPSSNRPVSSPRLTPRRANTPAMPTLRPCLLAGRESCGPSTSGTRRATDPPVAAVVQAATFAHAAWQPA